MTDDARELCENKDCDRCHPLPRWAISQHRIQHITYEREIKAATREEALQIFEGGTAHPSSYDDNYGEVVQQDEAVIVQMTDADELHARKLKYYRTQECLNDPERLKAMEEFLTRRSDSVDEFSETPVVSSGEDP
jgi:hypothetical protein